MAFNMKEVASLRGNDKLYAENAAKIDWSGVGGKAKGEFEDIENEPTKSSNTSELFTYKAKGSGLYQDFTDALVFAHNMGTNGEPLLQSHTKTISSSLLEKYGIKQWFSKWKTTAENTNTLATTK